MPTIEQAIIELGEALEHLVGALGHLSPPEALPPAGEPYVNPLEARIQTEHAIFETTAAIALLQQVPGGPIMSLPQGSMAFTHPTTEQVLIVENSGEGELAVTIMAYAGPQNAGDPDYPDATGILIADPIWLSVPSGEQRTTTIELLQWPDDQTIYALKLVTNHLPEVPTYFLVTVNPVVQQNDPLLEVNPDALSFEWQGSETQTQQPFYVHNAGSGSLDYVITDDQSSLIESIPAEGSSGGEVQTHQARVNWGYMSEGETIDGTITVTAGETEPPPDPPAGDGNYSEHLEGDPTPLPEEIAGNGAAGHFEVTDLATGQPFDGEYPAATATWGSAMFTSYSDHGAAVGRNILMAKAPTAGEIFSNIAGATTTGGDFVCITPSPDYSALLALENDTADPHSIVWRSTDGLVWTAVLTNTDFVQAEAIYSVPEHNLVIAALCNDHNNGGAFSSKTKFYYSTDQGATWIAGDTIDNFYCKKLVRFDDWIYALGAYNPAASMWDVDNTYTMAWRTHFDESGLDDFGTAGPDYLGLCLDAGGNILSSIADSNLQTGAVVSGAFYAGKLYTGSRLGAISGNVPKVLSTVGGGNNGRGWTHDFPRDMLTDHVGGGNPTIDCIFVGRGLLYFAAGSHNTGDQSAEIAAYYKAADGSPAWRVRFKKWNGSSHDLIGIRNLTRLGDYIYAFCETGAAGSGTKWARVLHTPSASQGRPAGETSVGTPTDNVTQTETIAVHIVKPEGAPPPPPPPPPPPAEGCYHLSYMDIEYMTDFPWPWDQQTGLPTEGGGPAWEGWCLSRSGNQAQPGGHPPTTGPNGEKEFYDRQQGVWQFNPALGDEIGMHFQVRFNDEWHYFDGNNSGLHFGGWSPCPRVQGNPSAPCLRVDLSYGVYSSANREGFGCQTYHCHPDFHGNANPAKNTLRIPGKQILRGALPGEYWGPWLTCDLTAIYNRSQGGGTVSMTYTAPFISNEYGGPQSVTKAMGQDSNPQFGHPPEANIPVAFCEFGVWGKMNFTGGGHPQAPGGAPVQIKNDVIYEIGARGVPNGQIAAARRTKYFIPGT